jgi:DNA-3-methyladenine glycosylase
MKLNRNFYTKPAIELAPLLLGKVLCRRIDGEVIRRAVTETEAYCGVADTACHAHKGRTPRTETLYAKGGTSYVYLCYGIHNLFNVIAAEEGEPQGVLLRGVTGAVGPGRVTKLMRIDRSLNNADMCESDELWLEDGPQAEYVTAPRVGIGYASAEDQAALWRFVVREK